MATVFGHRCDLVLSWARKAGMTLMIDKIGSGFMGSGVFAKAFTLEHAYAARDTEGKSVKEELERIDYLGPKEPGAHPIGTCFKTHIEQGPVLEDNDATIGVVIGVLGIKWCDRTVTGMEAHAGTTPMALRKDALQVATKLMQEVVAMALRYAPHGRGTVGTVGMVQVHPNSRNVIPGRVKFSIDLRNASDELVDKMDVDMRATVSKASEEGSLPITIEVVSNYPAQPFHTDCIEAVARAAKNAWLLQHACSFRCGAGCGLHGATRAGGNDLHPLQKWHQPQRN